MAEFKMNMKMSESDNDRFFVTFSPLFWISGIMSVMWPILRGTPRLQSSKPFSVELFAKAMKIYKVGTYYKFY